MASQSSQQAITGPARAAIDIDQCAASAGSPPHRLARSAATASLGTENGMLMPLQLLIDAGQGKSREHLYLFRQIRSNRRKDGRGRTGTPGSDDSRTDEKLAGAGYRGN